jgi:outer membrane protease
MMNSGPSRPLQDQTVSQSEWPHATLLHDSLSFLLERLQDREIGENMDPMRKFAHDRGYLEDYDWVNDMVNMDWVLRYGSVVLKLLPPNNPRTIQF